MSDSKLDAILDNLALLDDKQRGTPLRADDWNVLVGAVRELTELTRSRALHEAEALDASYARAGHEHRGQVGLGWLDGPTRALVEGRSGSGASTSFEARDDLRRVEKGLEGLRRDVEGTREELAAVRDMVLKLREEVLGGRRALGDYKARLESLKDIELDVSNYRTEFGQIDKRLSEVLVLRDKIGDGEGQVDLAGLASRIQSLEQLRSALVGEGQVPNLQELQQDLVKLSDRIDLGPEYGGGLGDGGLSPADKSMVEGLVEGFVDDKLGPRLEAELGPTKSKLDALAERTGASEDILATHGDRLGQLDTLEANLGELDGRLGQLDLSSQTFGSKLGELDGRLGGLGEELSALQPALDGLGQLEGLAGLGDRIGAVETELGGLDGRFAAAEALAGLASKDALAALGTELGAGLDGLREASLAHAGRLDGVELGLADAGAGLDDLGTRFGQVEAGAVGLQDWRAAVDSQLGSLANVGPISPGSLADSLAGSLTVLGDRVVALEGSVESSLAWRTGVDSRLDAAEVGLVAAGEGRAGLATSLDAYASTLSGLDASFANVDSQLAALAGFRTAASASLETLAAKTAELDSFRVSTSKSLGSVQVQLSALSGYGDRLASLESTTSALDSWRLTADAKLETMGSSLGVAESSLAGLSSQLSATKQGLASLSQTVKGTATRVNELSVWRESATTSLTKLEVDAAKSLELGGRLTKLESSLVTPVSPTITTPIRDPSIIRRRPPG